MKGGNVDVKLRKMGWWNVDAAYSSPTTAVMVSGRLLDMAGKPVANTQLWSRGVDYHGSSADITDAQGKFSNMIVQFSSVVNIEVHCRKQMDTDNKLKISFWQRKALSSSKHRAQLLELQGEYVKEPGLDGEPAAWYQCPPGTGRIEWNAERRRWQHIGGTAGTVFFVKKVEEPTSPAGMGWEAPMLLQGDSCVIHPPLYETPSTIVKVQLGPFDTGEAGEYLRLGDHKVVEQT